MMKSNLKLRQLTLCLLHLALWPLVAPAQSDLALLVSPPDDYIGQGQTHYTANPSELGAFKTASGLQLTAFGYIIELAAPGQGPLAVQNYTNAISYPGSETAPGILISGNGRGCTPVCGEFQIRELELDGADQLVRLWVTFAQRYPCSSPPLTGELRYHSRLAPPAPLPRTLQVPTDYPTIQAALDSTFDLALDRILVEPGLYTESVQFGGKRAQLLSTAGPTLTYILPPAGGAAVTFSGATPEALLCGFTLMDGGTGVAITRGGSPTVVSNAIVNCGTGIDCNSGSIDLRGSPNLRGNSIVGCAGAAINLAFTGAPLIEGNQMEDNGGGIAMWEAGAPLIRNNIIRRNHGAGIHMLNNCDAEIVQNLIVENDSDGIGWLVPSGARGPWVVNNTIVNNRGAAIAADGFDGAAQIINNILVGNPALWVGAFNDLNPPLIQYNDVYSPAGLAFAGSIPDLAGVDGNLSANPFFACAPGQDFHLLAGSPCLEAGTNGAPLLPATDFDGAPRIRPSAGAGAGRVDLGAYEFNPAAPGVACLFLSCPSTVVAIAAPGAASAVVTFPPVQATPGALVTAVPPSGSVFPAGTNTVACTAVYGTNRLSGTFLVVVLQPPVITAHPRNLTVPAGSPAQLSVSAQGTAPLTYRWLREEVSLAATNAILALTNPQPRDEGFYRVIVTNAAGSVTSAPALVRVLPAAPAILQDPLSLTVGAGSNATFKVLAGGSEPLAFQWYRGATLLAGATASTLVISNVQAADAAEYSVIVSNALGGLASGSATLSVTPTPLAFVLQPGPLSLAPGTNGAITALARGSEPIRYQWRRSGVPLAGATQNTLAFSNATASIAGLYDLMASNFLGAITSRTAYVYVYGDPPHFIQSPASVEVLAGTTLTLTSQVSGTTPLQYQWFFQGAPLPGQTNEPLVLAAVTPAAAGAYSVVVTNRFGSATSAVAQVSVNQSLLIQQPLTNQITDRGRTVRLALGVAATGTVSYSWQWNGVTLDSTEPVLVLTNVQPAQSGDYTVTVANAFGALTSTARLTVFGPAGRVVAWGDNTAGQTEVPALEDVVAIAGGDFHSVALQRSGTLAGWGYNGDGQLGWGTEPTRFVGLAAGPRHSLAIAEDGTVRAWGRNDHGQSTVPTGLSSVVAVAAGDGFSLALLSSGSVVGWGDNTDDQLSLPWPWNGYRAIAAGRSHSLGLTRSGAVLACGLNTFGQASPPDDLTGVMAIAAGYLHSVALRSNGTVVAWGDNTFGQTNVPAGLSNVVAITAGDLHSFALLADGSVVGWGDYARGQMKFPAGLAHVNALASGTDHGLALIPDSPLLLSRRDPAGLVLEWSGAGVLQWAPTPSGPFLDLPGAVPPFTNVNPAAPAQFFRLRQ